MKKKRKASDVPKWAHQITNNEDLGPRTLVKILYWTTSRLTDEIRTRPTGEILLDMAKSFLSINDDYIWAGFEEEAIRNEAIARGDEDGKRKPLRLR